jgi:hypothetical protein
MFDTMLARFCAQHVRDNLATSRLLWSTMLSVVGSMVFVESTQCWVWVDLRPPGTCMLLFALLTCHLYSQAVLSQQQSVTAPSA